MSFKGKKKILLKFLSLLFIGLYMLPIGNIAKAEGLLDVNVEYGIDGKYKVGRNIPLNITVDNKGDNLEGSLEVEVPDTGSKYVLYTQNINLPKETKKQITMAVPLGDISKNIKVAVSVNNKRIIEKEIRVENGRVNETKLLTGVLSDDFNGLSYFGNVKLDQNKTKSPISEVSLVKLDEKNMGENSKTLESLDAIIINNFDTSKLSKEKYEALKTWVQSGKLLIIGTGVNYEKTLSLFKDDFINGTIGNVSKFNSNILNEKSGLKGESPLNIDLLNMSVKGGNNYLQDNGKSLITVLKKQRGSVVIVNYDLATEPMASFKGNQELWKNSFQELLSEDIKKGFYGGDFKFYKLSEMLRSIPGMKLPSIKLLSIIFLAYVLLVGPISYFLLKKLNKRQFLWGVIPGLAIVFGMVIYFVGSSTRINTVVSNRINFIEINEQGDGKVESYIGVMAPKKISIKVEEPKNITLSALKGNRNDYGPQTRENEKTGMSLKVNYEGNKTFFEYKDLAPFTPEILETNSIEGKFGNIESSLNFSDGNLFGTIKNNLGYDINQLFVVSGKGMWQLGKITTGENKEINGDTKYYRDMNQLMDELYRKNRNTLTTEEFRVMDFMEFYRQKSIALPENETKFLAITNIPAGYSILVDGKNTKEYDATLVTAPAKLNFINKEGVAEYPYGYFEPTVLRESGQGGYDSYSGTLYGNVDMDFSYNFDPNIKLQEIKIKLSEDKYNGEKFSGEYNIYNVKESKFEKVDITSGEVVLKDVDKYIEKDQMKINVKNNGDKGTNLPLVTIKGRVK